MTKKLGKNIITCALTGGIHTPSMSPHLPVTPEELIEESIAATEAGAAILHLHIRDPETGQPSSNQELFKQVMKGIREESDAIICPTTGGSVDMSVEERMKVIPSVKPEIATFNMGSMNFALHPIAEAMEEFEHDWEREYLEGTKDMIFPNTFESLEDTLNLFEENDVKPECECYDVGQIYNVAHLFERGLIDPPVRLQFVMGILGGIGTHPSDLLHMKNTADRLLGDQYTFSVLGTGRKEFPIALEGISLGGDTRVGLEDNLYLEKGRLAESNAELVEKMVRLTKDVYGMEHATPEEAREFLELKGSEKTDI